MVSLALGQRRPLNMDMHRDAASQIDTRRFAGPPGGLVRDRVETPA
jgi:hypothetical protein